MGAKRKITERALYQRVARGLQHDGKAIRTARYIVDGNSLREDPELGRYFVIDTSRNIIVDKRVDLQEYGRDLGVLKAWEEVEWDD